LPYTGFKLRNVGKTRDEIYILDLCDRGRPGKRQHPFDFLIGDTGRRLLVDAYYPELKLVIEYAERQHTEAVAHFDKRMTQSGVSRGEQRKVYDKRRQEKLAEQGIALVVLDYSDFPHNSRKRLRRILEDDEKIVRGKLVPWL
jgi:hypothetical protein